MTSTPFRVYHSLDEVPADFGPSAVTIGNFDGVHIGHRRILRRVCEIAREHHWKPSVLTFAPHPARIVAPERAPRLMTTPEQRAGLMREEGIEQVLILPFTQDVANLAAEEFVGKILVAGLGARAIVVGDNFRFGHKKAGDTRLLKSLGERLGFCTEVVPSVSFRRVPVSSSALRKFIEAGDVTRAGRLLTRPFALEGEVVPGRGVGSRQTVPTLNLAPLTELVPKNGVYVTRTTDLEGGRSWDSVTNVGYRPTFGSSGELSIETFLLDRLEGAAPRSIRLEFLRRLRDERKFESPEALKAQIFKDVTRARAYFRRSAQWKRQTVLDT